MQSKAFDLQPKPFFIAEIGINHNGDIKKAFKLIDLAVEAGFNAVKFQKRTIDLVYSKDYLDCYRESPFGNTNRDLKEALEFTENDYCLIDSYCREKGIDWFASAWDVESQKFLRKFDLKYNKIASAMLTHPEIPKLVAEEQKFTFISINKVSENYLDSIIELFLKHDTPFCLMHCVSVYPCEDIDCNLQRILELRIKYPDIPIGYSGHEKGILPTVLAIYNGAVAVERHITLDRTMFGSDQSASLEKKGMELVVRDGVTAYLLRNNSQYSWDLLKEEQNIMNKLRYW